MRKHSHLWKSLGPIILSAFSFFCASVVIQLIGTTLNSEFSLLHTRGMGKFIFIFAAIVQLACFVTLRPFKEFKHITHHAAGWPFSSQHLKTFVLFFAGFSAAHIGTLGLYYLNGFGHVSLTDALTHLSKYSPASLVISGFAALLVAWTEELIFRGVLYSYFASIYPQLPSALITSFIFMSLHNLTAPWNLVTTEWKLGLGLFLLGLFLNLLMLQQQSIGASSGAHAGLVFIKVALRKFPLILVPLNQTYLFPEDLRESLLTHVGLTVGCIALYIMLQKNRRPFPDADIIS